MSKTNMPPEPDPQEIYPDPQEIYPDPQGIYPDPLWIYPDPLGIAEKPALFHNLTDIALAGDMPASRLFSNLSVSLERDIRGEMIRERREMRGGQRGE